MSPTLNARLDVFNIVYMWHRLFFRLFQHVDHVMMSSTPRTSLSFQHREHTTMFLMPRTISCLQHRTYREHVTTCPWHVISRMFPITRALLYTNLFQIRLSVDHVLLIGRMIARSWSIYTRTASRSPDRRVIMHPVPLWKADVVDAIKYYKNWCA